MAAARGSNVLLQVFRTSHAVGALLQHAVAGTGVSAPAGFKRAFGDLRLTHLRGNQVWRLRVG